MVAAGAAGTAVAGTAEARAGASAAAVVRPRNGQKTYYLRRDLPVLQDLAAIQSDGAAAAAV